MELPAYILVALVQTGTILYFGGRWQGRIEAKVDQLRTDFDEHKALPAFRAHG